MQNTEPRILPSSEAPARKRTKRVVATATAPVKRRGQSRQAMAALSARKRVAVAIGAVASVVLLLSVFHCAEAINLLTGMHPILAAALAIGIDCGMVGAEVTTVVSQGVAARRARLYVAIAVGASAVLNAIASAQHAPEGYVAVACGIGAIVPVLVLLLGQVASHLWTE